MQASKYLMAVVLALTSTFPAWAANPSSKNSVSAAHPLVHQVNTRVRKQWLLIQQGLKNGKLTKDQATSLRTSLKSIRQQEVTFFRQNNKHELTSDQQNQLNSTLDKNSSTLGETTGSSNP